MKQTKTKPVQPKSEFERLNVTRFMERDVQSGRPSTKANEIASMMVEGLFGAIPIVDEERRLIGIVSEYDLLSSLEKGHRWSELLAEDIMTSNAFSVRPETNVATLVDVLLTSNLIRVPVVDAEHKLVGIVARRDILRTYLNYGLESAQGVR
jgi:CBS-domain-containing membrane protein